MRRSHTERTSSLVVEHDQPVVAIPLIENGREVVRYLVETEAGSLPGSVHDALRLAGAWRDLDWDETIEALDRIRHESRPTPPIESTNW